MAPHQPKIGGFWRGVLQNAVGSWIAALLSVLITPPLVILANAISMQLMLLIIDQGAVSA